MNLKDLGWNPYFEKRLSEKNRQNSEPARVTEELKGFYRLCARNGEFLAQVAGKVRFHASGRGDFPAVGDWVAIETRPEEDRATIQFILPRRTKLSRKAARRAIDEQVLAANVDTVFIVAALNQELNLRRIERYIALVWESGARPVVLLNKSDLCVDVSPVATEVQCAAPGVAVHALSGVTGAGLAALACYLAPGQTAAFIGSSGVGKSTLINALLGTASQAVKPVREGDDRGRHTTTSRQLFLLPAGGIVIDTPGMRELQLWDAEDGLPQAFDDIERLVPLCKFRDCRHQSEPECAVQRAIDDGDLDPKRLANYRKLQAEIRFIEGKRDLEVALEAKKRSRRLCKEVKRLPKRY